jgi:hypothetical protein
MPRWKKPRFEFRVTRWVCETVAQNVAQLFFREYTSFAVEKSGLKILASSEIFKKAAQR